jgi:ankyrin repeat protein
MNHRTFVSRARIAISLIVAFAVLGLNPSPAKDSPRFVYRFLTPQQILFRAIKNGDIATVRKMLDRGIDINVIGSGNSEFPLYCAVYYDQPEIVKLLLKRGADVNEKTPWHDNSINRACWLGYRDIIDMLLKAGAEKNDSFYYAGTDDVEGLKELQARAPMSQGTLDGALQFATVSDSQRAFDWILAQMGPLTNWEKTTRLAPMYDSVGRGGHIDMLHHLEKADPCPEKNESLTLWSTVMFNHVPMARYLLSKPELKSRLKAKDESCLLFIAQSPEMVKFLINQGADVEARNNDGQTPLMQMSYATWNPPEDTLVMLKHGADATAQDNTGNTALMYATDGATVKILMRYGADIRIKNKAGQTALDFPHDPDDQSRRDALLRYSAEYGLSHRNAKTQSDR